MRQVIVEDHKPQDELHEHKKVERCISERKESLPIIDSAGAQSLLSFSSPSVNSLLLEHVLGQEPFQTPDGALRAARRSRTRHGDHH